jgi:predicted KAP-like P-loop ATPase
VPRLGVEEVRAYLLLLLFQSANSDLAAREKLRLFLIERLRRSWTHDQSFAIDDAIESVGKKDDADLRRALDMADRMAPLLAHAAHVQGNPRIVKRLLNVVRMRASIAAKRKMPLDEAIIAKLALFERCVDTSATETLHNAINAASDGKLKFLRGIESGEPIDEHKSELPDKWQPFLPFIADWARLQPKLADIDLKPAVYLARETIPVRVSSGAVPPAVTKAVEELVRTPSMSSRAAADAVTALKGGHETAAMEAIVTHMRKDTDWSRVRADARGAVLLARSSTEAAKVASRFFRDLPSTPAWLRTMLKDEAWYEA